MNRFKKYIRERHGVKLESDYEFLPYHELDSVTVDSENARVCKYYYTIGKVEIRFDRNGKCVISD